MIAFDVNEFFADHFERRATLAESLEVAHPIPARMIASTALDAIGETWMHDFPSDRAALAADLKCKEDRIPSSIRMAHTVRRFAPGALYVGKVAVVRFAEHWKKYMPAAAAHADALIHPRLPLMPNHLPGHEVDSTKEELLRECPALVGSPAERMIEDYEYPAFVYRYVRCAHVHLGRSAPQAHGFAADEEAFYNGSAFAVGLQVITSWLRHAAEGYAAYCSASGVECGKNIDAGETAEKLLKSAWEKASKS